MCAYCLQRVRRREKRTWPEATPEQRKFNNKNKSNTAYRNCIRARVRGKSILHGNSVCFSKGPLPVFLLSSPHSLLCKHQYLVNAPLRRHYVHIRAYWTVKNAKKIVRKTHVPSFFTGHCDYTRLSLSNPGYVCVCVFFTL